MSIVDRICIVLTALALLGFIDWLWIFGVEGSQSYTWWYLIYEYGGK